MIFVARGSTSRWLSSQFTIALATALPLYLALSVLFPRHDLLLKLSKLVSVARVIYLRLNEIEYRLNSPRPDNSHNFIRRQAGQRDRKTDRLTGRQSLLWYLHRFIHIYIYRANRFLLAVVWERGIFLNSEIIMPVDKSTKFRWPLPSATAQLALGLVINLNLIFLLRFNMWVC